MKSAVTIASLYSGLGNYRACDAEEGSSDVDQSTVVISGCYGD